MFGQSFNLFLLNIYLEVIIPYLKPKIFNDTNTFTKILTNIVQILAILILIFNLLNKKKLTKVSLAISITPNKNFLSKNFIF